MDLSRGLRAAQEVLDQADTDLKQARTTLDSSARTYNDIRGYPSEAAERARQAWGLALMEWASALIAQAGAKDRRDAERRRTDHEAADHLHLPTRSPR